MPEHTVRQGECLSSIAKDKGFRNYRTIYQHPRNAQFRRLRPDPNVILPGDRLYIPDHSEKEAACGTNQKHRFKVKASNARFRLRLTLSGKPREKEPYTLVVDGRRITGQTTGDGWIDQKISPGARSATLILKEGEEQYTIQLGHIDPIEAISGIQGRLRNLGFYGGEINGQLDDATRAGIQAFQKKHGLNLTGEPDQQTRNKLRSAYGS